MSLLIQRLLTVSLVVAGAGADFAESVSGEVFEESSVVAGRLCCARRTDVSVTVVIITSEIIIDIAITLILPCRKS